MDEATSFSLRVLISALVEARAFHRHDVNSIVDAMSEGSSRLAAEHKMQIALLIEGLKADIGKQFPEDEDRFGVGG